MSNTLEELLKKHEITFNCYEDQNFTGYEKENEFTDDLRKYVIDCCKASLEKAKSKLVKITDEAKPIAYRTGNWDGKNSDVVIAIGSSGKYYVALYSEGILDGEKFEDWYDENEYLIDEDITHWMEPDYFKESITNLDNIVIL